MVVEVTKEKVVIKESSVINTDEIGINKCRFILPSCFHGLEVTALFNYIPVPLVDNECIIPSLGKGNAVLGVYAYKSEGDEPQIMYSPKPASFYVSQGSYSEQVNEAAVVQISLYEQYCKMLAEKYKEEELAREEAEAIRVTAENLRLQAEQDRVSAELVRSEAFSNIFDRDGNIVIGSDNIENGAVTLDKVSQYFFRDGVNCTVGNDITLHLTQKVPDNKVYLSAELTSKTDEITEESTNEIPTAKAVFDYVNEFDGGSDYTLPVGGEELGGVKNGGNVVINEDGTMNAPETEVTDEQVSSAVSDWLDEHPEATTSVQDGSISMEKLSSDVDERFVSLEAEVFEERVTTDTTEGISPDVVLEWAEGYAYGINGGIYEANAQYNSTQKFETTVFPEITKPELLTETAGSLVAFWNNDVFAGYWTNGQYYNASKKTVNTLTFTHAAFSIRSATDYTQIELVYAEVIETVTKVSKIQDVRDRTTALEYKTGVLETKVQALENGGTSGGSGESGEGDTSRQGKKYYLFGDSITYWDSRASWYDDTVYMVAYPSYIRDVLQAEIVNCGVAGNNAKNITARLKTTNLTDAYAVTYMSGANDLNQNVPIGTIGEFDTTTYIGNIETAIKYVAENYPQVKFYLLSPIFTTLGDIKPYAEAMQSVADHYSIPILRWDRVSQINQFNSNYYTVEGIHPNNLGHALMADSLLPFLRNH